MSLNLSYGYLVLILIVLLIGFIIWLNKGYKQKEKELKQKHPNGFKWKSTAIFLALFFGFFSWLYTYRKDRWKFWLCIILFIISFVVYNPLPSIFVIVYILSVFTPLIDHIRRPKSFYENYYENTSVRFTKK